jgi:acetyl esterase/lipase
LWLPIGTSAAPVLIEFLGRYWQFGNREALALAVESWTARGTAFTSAAYQLATATSLAEIFGDPQAQVAKIGL